MVENNAHVLTECQEWKDEREELALAYGGRVESLGALFRGMAVDPLKWKAMLEFARKIIDRKENGRKRGIGRGTL